MDNASDAPGLLERNPWVVRRKLDIDDYYRMTEAGILHEDDRVELIEGELIEMGSIGSPHAGTVNGLNRMLVMAVGRDGVVTVQNPVRLDRWSEPQPDFCVLRPRADDYRGAHPLPQDVLLIVEIAQSSLAYDRRVKLPLYARHGIPEVWVVDLGAGEVEVSRTPGADGYAETVRVGRGGVVALAALPHVVIAVSDLLG